MKNLRNILKKLTAVTLLAAILFTGSVITSNSGNPDDGIMPLGSYIADVKEF